MAKLLAKKETYEMIRQFAESDNNNVCFIFGAGASYGYTNAGLGYNLPPTVADLFSEKNLVVKEVINRGVHTKIKDHSQHIKEVLGSEYNNDLEAYLSEQYRRNSRHGLFPALLSYLHDIFSTSSEDINVNYTNNNYKKLINKMSDFRGENSWSCISFNYDVILEKSCKSSLIHESRNFRSISCYLKENPKIIKIHGGINYYAEIEDDNPEEKFSAGDVFDLIMNKDDLNTKVVVSDIEENSYTFLQNNKKYDKEKKHRILVNLYTYPLMMIPIHATSLSKNNFFKRMTEEAKKEIDASSLVVAVGYNFGDELFVNSLNGLNLKDKSLLLVGTTSERGLVKKQDEHTCFKNISKIWPHENIKIFNGNGFSEFTNTMVTNPTLSKTL